MSARLRGWLFAFLRLVISVGLLWWLLGQLRGGFQEVRAIDPKTLLPAGAVFALSTVLGAWQWSLILHRAGIRVSGWRLQALYWIGLFFNNFLPSNVGGDLVKVADVAVSTGRVARPVAGTLLDRMLGLSALVGLAFLGGALLGQDRPAGLPWWALLVLTLPVLLLSAGILSGRLGRVLLAIRDRLRPGTSGGRLRGLLRELQAYRSDPGFVIRLALLALLVQSLRVATHLMVARAMGIPLDPERILQFYVLVPVLGVAVVLPLSFNGLGVRELVATRLMPDVGITAESAFALQLTTYLVQVAVSLLGGVVFAAMMIRGRLRFGRVRPVEGSPGAREGGRD